MKSKVVFLAFSILLLFSTQTLAYSEFADPTRLDSIFNTMLKERDSIKNIPNQTPKVQRALCLVTNNISALVWIYGSNSNQSKYLTLINTLINDLELQSNLFRNETFFHHLSLLNRCGLLEIKGTESVQIYNVLNDMDMTRIAVNYPVLNFLHYTIKGRLFAVEGNYEEAVGYYDDALRALAQPFDMISKDDKQLLYNAVYLDRLKSIVNFNSDLVLKQAKFLLQKPGLSNQQLSDIYLLLAKSFKQNNLPDSSTKYFEMTVGIYKADPIIESLFSNYDDQFQARTMESLKNFEIESKSILRNPLYLLFGFAFLLLVFVIVFYSRRGTGGKSTQPLE